MMKFVYCDTNVTPQLRTQVEQLISENPHQIMGPNSALFLSQLFQQHIGHKWSVFLFSNAAELQYVVQSPTQIQFDIEIGSIKIIISQSKDSNADCAPKDAFVKQCQHLAHNISMSESPLQIMIRESYAALEESIGEGCNIVMCVLDSAAQMQFVTQGVYEQEFSSQVDDEYIIRTVVFYTPMSGINHQDQISDVQQYQQGHQDEYDDQVLINDEYEEPMELQFQVMLDEQQMLQSSDQVKVSFDQLEIQPLKLRSFSIIFQVFISPNPKEIKDDLNIISTGSSLMSKNMTFGINRDSLFFYNFSLMTGKQESLYSQIKIKRNQWYQIALVYSNSEIYKEVSMYINGKIENQISISQGIEPPRGYFWIGSEQALKLFKGSIRDVVFLSQSLHHKHIKSIYAELQSALTHKFVRKTIEIVEEVMLQLKDDIPAEQDVSETKFTNSQSMSKQPKLPKSKQSKTTSIPQHLQKHYHQFDEIDNKKQKLQGTNEPRTQKEISDKLHQELLENDYLFHKCHEMSINFYWVFTSVQQLAPPLEDNGQARLPFEYLHQELCKEKFDYYPVYAIELERLAKVIHHAGIALSQDEIYNLANTTDTLRMNKVYGYYVLYDKFLLILREASLSQQEIEIVQSQYNQDEKEADQDLLVISDGIQRIKTQPQFNFGFFSQLVTLVGSEHEAFKYYIQHLIAYFVQNSPYVQKLTASYVHKETGQEVEIEGIELFSFDQDKILQQKIDISDEVALKFFRVHYNGENMAMIAFKTHQAEETFLFDKSFQYQPGQDATGQLETYAVESYRLAGFKGTIVKDATGLNQIVVFHAEYLKKDPRVEELKRQQPEMLPQLPESWNQGKFQIVVNRCSDCDKHNTTTWHQEQDFALKFNEFGTIFKDLFPNVEIIGNWDKTQQLEHFDVYIRGIGQNSRWDREGRIFLLKKNEKLQAFLNAFLRRILKVYDDIVLMAQAYGDTNEMQRRQELFLKQGQFPPKQKGAHDHPCPVPDRIEKAGKEDAGYAGTDFICKNWGCGQEFKYEGGSSGIKKCKHHPGRYEFGSKHGLWPECWTCCGKPWETEGCKLDFHRGVPDKDYYDVCINTGPIDAKTGYPEHCCGMRFTEADGGECKFNGGVHMTAKWPDPQAKALFIQKSFVNPALKEGTQPMKTHIKPDMFRETKPYKEFVNKDRQRLLKLIDTEKEFRQCTSWGCGKQYKEIENRKKRMCLCHPGVFDFGHTATTIQEAVEEYKAEKGSKILWKPHWTCCRKSWNEQGCTLQQHNGPLVVDYVPRKYQWPDHNAQAYFKKKVSENWTRMLNGHHRLEPDQASMKYDALCKTLGSGGQISAYKLAELCDKFKLNLWVCSEDLSYQFKFQDVLQGQAQEYLADQSGQLDKHKFLDWWFADVEKLKEIAK